jgi:hypothetical protein
VVAKCRRPGRFFRVAWGSQLGPRAQPQLLVQATDDVLISEAMRLQQERPLDQGGLWSALCSADPERAYRGLQSEARKGRWEAIPWRELLCAAADHSDPALQSELAESLLSMPETTLRELLQPAASWLQKRRETLTREPADDSRFLRLWDRFAALTYSEQEDIQTDEDSELLTNALNDPAGSLAWTFLDQVGDAQLKPNSEFRQKYSERLALAAAASGRPGLFARVMLMRSLAYLQHIDPKWTETYLMPALTWNQPGAGAMWRSYALGGHTGTARLFNAIKDSLLMAFAQPTMSGDDLEGLVMHLLRIAVWHQRGEATDYLITSGEIKRALSVALSSSALVWHEETTRRDC